MSPRHVASLLLVCLVLSARISGSRGAPPRLTLDQGAHPGVAGRLLGALVSSLLYPDIAERQQQQQQDEEEFAHWEAEPLGWDASSLERGLAVNKRCVGLSTCILADLTDKLHKLNAPRTDVGVQTPGRKRRELPSSSASSSSSSSPSSSHAGTARGPPPHAPGGVASSSSSGLKSESLPPV